MNDDAHSILRDVQEKTHEKKREETKYGDLLTDNDD